MSWASSAPLALTNLVAALKAALADLDVRDGPTVTGSTATEALVVGCESDTSPAIEHQITVDAAGAASPNRERFRINSEIVALSGTGNVADARNRAYTRLAQVGQVLVDDHTLGGVVMHAHIGEVTLMQQQSKRGAFAQLRFGIDCDAFTQF